MPRTSGSARRSWTASGDAYRRLRNTLRYLLGNLAGFDEAERLPPSEMPELERWVLHRLAELDALVRECQRGASTSRGSTALHNFCAIDLSAFYFDVRKDALYCDRAGQHAPPRRAHRARPAVPLPDRLAGAGAVLHRRGGLARPASRPRTTACTCAPSPTLPASGATRRWRERWERIREVRRVVTGALEVERREKRIGSSLQAAPGRLSSEPRTGAALDGLDLAELAITSGIELQRRRGAAGRLPPRRRAGRGGRAGPADGDKCARCWRVLPEVGGRDAAQLCRRCSDALGRRAGLSDAAAVRSASRSPSPSLVLDQLTK